MNSSLETCSGDTSQIDSKGEFTNASMKKKRILLADDSPQIRESLSKLLRKAGYNLTPVATGEQALDRALVEEFDLLLLDLNMPGTDGWMTLGRLTRLKPELPVVIITAQPDQNEWAIAAGARSLLEKPLDLPRLLQTIREFTNQTSESSVDKGVATTAPFDFNPPDKNDFRLSESNHRWQTN